jgi:uncharacterized protein (TIGR02466 family)
MLLWRRSTSIRPPSRRRHGGANENPDEHRRARPVCNASRGIGGSGCREAQCGVDDRYFEKTRREILNWGGEHIGHILDLAKEVANRLTADRNGKSVRPAWSVTAWANVNGPGDANICHYHPGAFWSGSYYVADGGCATDHSLGGEFEMLDPRGAAPAMYAPALKFAGEDGQSVGAAETIRPRPGLLFLFPSWLFHQVRPYRGDGLRISIAFNLSV